MIISLSGSKIYVKTGFNNPVVIEVIVKRVGNASAANMNRRTAKSGNDSAVILKLSDSATLRAFPTFPILPLLPVHSDSQHSSSTQ